MIGSEMSHSDWHDTWSALQALSVTEKMQAADGEDRTLFVTTDESGVEEVIEILKNGARHQKGCHIGVSGWYNYDIASVSHPECVIVVDKNPAVIRFHEASIETLKTASTRTEFVAQIAHKLFSCRLCPNGDVKANALDHFIFHCSVFVRPKGVPKTFLQFNSCDSIRNEPFKSLQKALQEELVRPQSWLGSDESYLQIRQLAQSAKIIPLRLDLTANETFEKMSQILQKAALKVSSLYLSNVYDERICRWVPEMFVDCEKERARFIQSVRHIIDEKTCVIDAVSYFKFRFDHGRQTRHTIKMDQSVVYGKDPESKVAYDPDTVRELGNFAKSKYPKAPRLATSP